MPNNNNASPTEVPPWRKVLKIHPAALTVPKASAAERRKLVEDLKSGIGLIHPVVTLRGAWWLHTTRCGGGRRLHDP